MDTLVATCPSCDEIFEIDHPEVGREADCPNCGEALVVASLEPVVLRYALDMEEEASFPEDDLEPI